ncbi:MAG: MraY family glycosyltransferase [Oculatellaceae cyanobacterium bins.114]|nr:MraY family glycosyltransferase [Oculatellaceae cyanobacterium bins.114]
MIALITFALSLFTVLLTTPIVHWLGLRFDWVDHPGERKLHRQPMVRVGGIAICAGTLVALFALAQINEFHALSLREVSPLVGIVLGGISFFAIGLADDLLNLHPLVRLGLQAITTGLVWSLGIQVRYLPIPFLGALSTGFMSLPITFLWLAGVANAINWLDGMDGLATGIAMLTSLALAVICLQSHHPAIALMVLALAGATFGFLRYNAAPAKIFMGDGGSYFIGFMLAAAGVAGLMQEQVFVMNLLPFVVLAVPVIDMTFVIVSRLLDKKSPFFPDQRHLHHRLLQLGFSRQMVVWSIYGLTLLAGVGAIALVVTPFGWIGIGGVLLILSLSNLRLWQQFSQILLLKKVSAT